MPWGDGTGPWGLGPMTGRGAGYCAGFNVPGFSNPMPSFGFRRGFGWGRGFRGGRGFGRGFGRGWGRGRGFGWRRWAWDYPYPAYPAQLVPTQSIPVTPAQFQPQITKEQELQYLEQEIRVLEEDKKMLEYELGSIRKRLEEIKSK